jgi:hypothetical protein
MKIIQKLSQSQSKHTKKKKQAIEYNCLFLES